MAINKDELMKMTDSAFAKEYARIMKLSRVPNNLASSAREAYVNNLIEKLQEEGEELGKAAAGTDPATTPPPATTIAAAKKEDAGAAAVETSPPATLPLNPEKGIGMTTTRKSTKLTGAAAAKKKQGAAAAKKVYPAVKKKNPFRETSKKAKCFDLFTKGGERAVICAAMVKLGVTEATASTWFHVFTKLT
jgi:hypothetical protein